MSTATNTKTETKIHIEVTLKTEDQYPNEELSEEDQKTWIQDLEREAGYRCRLMPDVAYVETWRSQSEVTT